MELLETIGLFPGSFDPITLGHLDLIRRSAKLVDRLYVGVFQNTAKVGFLSNEEKVAAVQASVADIPNVVVVTQTSELTIHFARSLQATLLIRGVRSVKDYEYERDIALMNHELDPTIETMILISKPEFAHISSSILKEIWHFKGNIDPFVPQSVQQLLKNRGEMR